MIPDDTDIVLTHGMPYNTLDLVHNDNPYQNGNIQTKPIFNIVGDRYLSERINQIKPKLYIGGHIHDNPGYYSIKNNGIVIKDDIMYANVSIVDNNIEVVNIPKFITITK
jgi:Icc-related predicted phosphoesterase